MKKTNILLVITSIFLMLTGCDKNQETVQTVDWYKSHDSERKEVISKCKNNPGELEFTPNCINASRAETSLKLDAPSSFNLPPMLKN